jgi:ATP phosphoribosyltransferase regulatory subunit
MAKPMSYLVPPGSQDLLPADVRRRRRVQRAWFSLAEERGYEEVIPPTFEYEEVFTRGAGPELTSRLIRFVDRDGRVVALRADFTSSIARLVATRLRDGPLPCRLCYAGKVYRQEPEGGGRRRELFQLGAELIGHPGIDADLEVLRLAIATLRALGIREYQINLGDIRFLEPVFAGLSASAAERIRQLIDRRDRRGLAAAAAELGLSAAIASTLERLPELIGRGEVLLRGGELVLSGGAQSAIERLAELDARLDPAERAHIVYDLAEVRGLGYYTAMQFEIFAAGSGRAIGYGGRYDGLLALYGADRPAIGFALETDLIVELVGGPR